MASTIASPVPLRFDQSQQLGHDVHSTEPGRDTPLPQYEKTQSVPFTLNLQEDARNPGQFQLVVNISPKHQAHTGIPLNLATPKDLPAAPRDASKLTVNVPKLYQTQKSSPPTTPVQDKQGWSDLDAVPPEFLQKVVPDWNVTFSRSDSTASTQSKRLADIKARIKKKGKGYVVRLLKGSTADPNEIAEVDLGQQHTALETSSHELDSSDVPAELDSTQTIVPSIGDSITGRPDVFEIGTSNEPGVQRGQSSRLSFNLPISASSPRRTAGDVMSINSIAEESLSDAETLIPDVRSIGGRIDEDQTDTEFHSRASSVLPTRSASVSSIVKTPTRGLSLVGPVRRVEKAGRARTKNKTTHLELKRSDAHKSIKRRSPRGSTSNFATSVSFVEPRTDMSTLRERVRPISRHSSEQGLAPLEYNTWQHPMKEVKSTKPRHSRRLSADDLQTSSGPKTKLRLQTNIPRPKSTNTSPVVRRKKSPRIHQPAASSPSSVNSTDSSEQLELAPQWSEVDPSAELREALRNVFRPATDSDDEVESPFEERSIPQIVEPVDESQIGEIPFPSDIEIRSAPVGVGSPTLKFWSLAIGALSEKLHEGFKLLKDAYGAEPPVPPGHVRVRWTCSCGESLYDDFIEKRPNAARLLEAYLNRPRTHTPRSPTSRSSTASSMASIFDASSRASTLATPSSTYGGSSSWGKKAESSKYSPTRLRTNNPFSVRMPKYAEEAWLLTCANEGRLTPKIVHLDVNEARVKSDKDLALALREHYDHLNRRWFNWARLRGLTTIEFVQFEVHRNRFADIRATPSMPPKSAAPPVSTSDPEKTQAPSQHPYTFEPIDLLPPVGSTYLLHLFKHPTDYDGELITYLRSPKRRERLEFGMGWGINLVESFLAQRVWTVVMGICGLASAAFAVMWTIKKDDVQGAFGVAQWVLGLAALLVGGLQAWLE
ncbi:Nn.00g011020.m01.CDS01 [Neocucurbitaria sp. VM-36]